MKAADINPPWLLKRKTAMPDPVIVVGGGLAGSEAAWQLAEHGVPVFLKEMKPLKRTPAHHTDRLAELVCSNSLRSNKLSNAVGLLKEEMRRLHSLIMRCADEYALPAGDALAVDRDGFSDAVTECIRNHPMIRIDHEEVTEIPEGPVIIATGPLTSESLSAAISHLPGLETLNFYDAAAPIVYRETLDMEKVFRLSRYNRGNDYLNCPLTREEYYAFAEALVRADTAEIHGFEESGVFEGCMPIESMAKRGTMVPLFGPMKPVGLKDPKTGKEPFAVVQLRQDNAADTLYNLVGFQTRLKFGEQKSVFSMIPGLEHAEFARYGVMHRNTFLNSPGFLNSRFEMLRRKRCYFAGQMTGVEGYVESAASGLVAGLSLACDMNGEEMPEFPSYTAIGAMGKYIATSNHNFQPMNCSFGLIDPLVYEKGQKKIRDKKTKNEMISKRSLDFFDAMEKGRTQE